MQYLIYDNLQYWEVIPIHTTEYENNWQDTMQYNNHFKTIKNNTSKDFSFDLDSFYKHTKNDNVRVFLDGNAKEGTRTTTGVSAIATLKKVGCPSDLLIELTKEYCNKTGAEINHFKNILYK
jgi:UDP-galactopyranose mutase